MRRRHFFLFVVLVVFSVWLAFFFHSCAAGPPVPREASLPLDAAAPPAVRVGLGRCLRAASAVVAVRGPYELRSGAEVLARGDGLPRTEIRASGGLLFGGAPSAADPLVIVPDVDGTLEVEYDRDQRGNPAPPAAVRYRGMLLVYAPKDRGVVLVNEVGLEDYLKGVLAGEMSPDESVEALKAQAIVSRTYAVHEQRSERLRRVKGEKFDLYDDERSQVYGGMQGETGQTSRLVDSTRGMIVVYEGRPVRTVYSSACGGATEPAWEVLGGEGGRIPPLAGRKCGYCERRAVHRWEAPVVISKKEISERCLPKDLRGARVKSIVVTKTHPGGRACEVTVTLEGASRTVQMSAQDFKRGIASARLRSTLWDRIEDRGDAVAIVGRGYGHGAGMCQVGACEMARDGKTAAEIIEYYFPGAEVRKLY